jgi:peptide/nickel transport system substrate-binding protein
MPRHASRATVSIAVIAIASAAIVTSAFQHRRTDEHAGRPTVLVASLRAEPRSFNRYTARDFSTAVMTLLMHDTLVRINRVTNEVEPELAEHWDRLDGGRSYRLHLRHDVRFSDGVPFSAEDVVFSFKAIYDANVDSVLADTLRVREQPLTVTAEDSSTVVVGFPSAFEPGLRMLDGVPIYPRHRLESALRTGAFRSAWSVSTAPKDLAGLGPFVLREHLPGERLTFERNSYYWRKSATANVDRVSMQIIPDQDSELLQLENGSIDLTQSELRPTDVPALTRATAHLKIADAGVGLDGDLFWLNLGSGRSRDRRAAWLQHRDFRRAIAHAVDRRAFADTVYFGGAVPADSIVSSGNREWHAATSLPDFDTVAAQHLIARLGLSRDRSTGMLHDANGSEIRFSLLTQKGNTSLERGAAFIRDSMRPLGVRIDVVSLEVGALIARIMQGDYDAAYFRILTTDVDPALNLDFWLSSGSAHLWNPGQPAPSTKWEAEIDRLMDIVATHHDRDERVARFEQVQQIMAEELPTFCFAFPRFAVALSARVAGAEPVAFRPPVLWAAERLHIP